MQGGVYNWPFTSLGKYALTMVKISMSVHTFSSKSCALSLRICSFIYALDDFQLGKTVDRLVLHVELSLSWSEFSQIRVTLAFLMAWLLGTTRPSWYYEKGKKDRILICWYVYYTDALFRPVLPYLRVVGMCECHCYNPLQTNSFHYCLRQLSFFDHRLKLNLADPWFLQRYPPLWYQLHQFPLQQFP